MGLQSSAGFGAFAGLKGFNAHHGMWGCEYTNCSGRSLVEALDVHDLVVLNTITPTHFSLTGRNAWSLLDLVLVSSSCVSL